MIYVSIYKNDIYILLNLKYIQIISVYRSLEENLLAVDEQGIYYHICLLTINYYDFLRFFGVFCVFYFIFVCFKRLYIFV